MTIFSRLMLSYLALLLMATGVSTYSILQLGQMQGITRSIIQFDTRLLDLHKNMADALLSASRYEKNIVVLCGIRNCTGAFSSPGRISGNTSMRR